MFSVVFHPTLRDKQIPIFGCDNCGAEAEGNVTAQGQTLPPKGWIQDNGFALGANQSPVIVCSLACRDTARDSRGVKTFRLIAAERTLAEAQTGADTEDGELVAAARNAVAWAKEPASPRFAMPVASERQEKPQRDAPRLAAVN